MAGQETGATPGEQGADGDTDEHVRLFAFVKRREGLSREEFLQYWRESHGPLIRDTPGLGDKVLRYEQFAARPDDGSPWDGVAMQEFASWDDFLSDPEAWIDFAYDKRRLPIASNTKVRP